MTGLSAEAREFFARQGRKSSEILVKKYGKDYHKMIRAGRKPSQELKAENDKER